MNRTQDRKKIMPAKCFFKTNRQGVPYKYCLTNDMDYSKYNRLTLRRNEERLVKAEDQLDNQEEIVKDLKAEIRKNKSKLAQDKRKKEETKSTTKKLGSEILGKIKSKLKSKSITEIKKMDSKTAEKQDKEIRKEIKYLKSLKPANDSEADKIKSEIKKLKEKQKKLDDFLSDTE